MAKKASARGRSSACLRTERGDALWKEGAERERGLFGACAASRANTDSVERKTAGDVVAFFFSSFTLSLSQTHTHTHSLNSLSSRRQRTFSSSFQPTNMAQSAAGAAGGGGNNKNSNENGSDDVGCVWRAVAQGETAGRVRELIEQYASAGGARTRRSYEARRSAAVNYKSSANGHEETPLEAAHDSERGDLVGVLLENGADTKALGQNCHALALVMHYGLTDTLRELLRSGRHQANEALMYDWMSGVCGRDRDRCSPVHLAVDPPPRSFGSARPPPRIDALHVLVREFGVDVNA